MNIRLDKKAEAFIARKVQEGEFRDADEATSEAVHRMAEHEEQMRELRAALQIGIDQADRGETVRVGPDYVATVMARAKAKAAAGARPKPDVIP